MWFYTLPPGFDDDRPDGATRGLGRFLTDEVAARAANGGISPAEALANLEADALAGRFAPHSVADAEGNTIGVWAFAPASVSSARKFPRESISVALDTASATVAARNR